MRKQLIIACLLVMATVLCMGCQSTAEEAPPAKGTPVVKEDPENSAQKAKPDNPGCTPEVLALADHAVVELKGKGEGEIVVVTDPLCWHCRLGHKLLGEISDQYGTLKILFFPRKSFIGSDMAAWVLEDAAGTEHLRAMVDFAYSDLQQPKTEDLNEARMLILVQFAARFPHLIENTTVPDEFIRLQKKHGPHVQDGAIFAHAARIPGTPVLIAGKAMVVGYGAPQWEKAVTTMQVCE